MSIDTLIATDLDGTLFYPKKTVRMLSSGNRRFVDRFLDDGGKMLLVTGRSARSCSVLAERLDRKFDLVCCNGSLVISNGKVIRELVFDSSYLKKILSDVRRDYPCTIIMLFTKNSDVVVLKSSITGIYKAAFSAYMKTQFNYREHYVSDDRLFYEEIEKGEVLKVLLFFGFTKKMIKVSEEAAKLFTISYPEVNSAWSKEVVEISPQGATKSSGLLFYLDYNKIESHNVMVVGDSGNDISMFDAFPKQSFCMYHSPAAVQSHAAHVIKHFYDLKAYVYPSVETKD